MSAKHEGELALNGGVLATVEDLLHLLPVVQLQRQAQSLIKNG